MNECILAKVSSDYPFKDLEAGVGDKGKQNIIYTAVNANCVWILTHALN